MTVIGLYEPGSSVLHRISVGWKVLGLLVVITAIVLADHPWQLGVAAVVLAAGFAIGRIRPAVAWAQLWPMRWIVLLVAIFQIVFAGLQPAIMLCGTLVLSVAAAALVTLTTRVSRNARRPAAAAASAAPRRCRSRSDRVGAGADDPVHSAAGAGDAERLRSEKGARTAGSRSAPWPHPCWSGALRTADEMGDALVARGVDD